MSNGILGDCGGPMCGFGVTGEDLGCTTGNGSCWMARMVEAAPSPFHDNQLITATRQIRQILANLRPPDGKTASFVHTPFGTLLAWVEHGVKPDDTTVTFESTPDEIADALGLIVEDGGKY